MTINNEVIELLKTNKNIALFTHVNPDGDCLGSASALKEALLLVNSDKIVDIYCDDTPSSNYDFLPHIKNINKPSGVEYDLCVAVDCSDANRLGKTLSIFKSGKKTIKIDHHKTVSDFAQVNVVETVSSTCLILYYYINELNININSNIALSLYSGIASDTGCFAHSNTTSIEHIVAGKLLENEFDLETANYNLFKHRTKNQILLKKIALNNLNFYLNDKVAIMHITLNDFKNSNTKKNDTIGFTDEVANIEGVEIGITLSEERKGLFSCSMRCKGNIDVSVIGEAFGGGGHSRAAGCNIFGHLHTVTNKLLDEIKKQL